MFHKLLNDQANALGYNLGDEGICYGIACMALQAILANDFERFEKRLELILKIPLENFKQYIESINKHQVEKIAKIKKLQLPPEEENKLITPSEAERFLLEIKAFFEGIAIYFQPSDYRHLHSQDNTQQNFQKTFELVLPQALDGQKIVTASTTGIYKERDLIQLFRCIRKKFEQEPNIGAAIPILLSNVGHTILISYSPITRRWTFVDSNYLPPIEVKDEKNLTALIMKAFKSNIIVMRTQIYSTNKNEALFFEKVNQLHHDKTWVKLHKVTRKKAKYEREDGKNWLYAAVINNEYGTTQALIENGTMINTKPYISSPLYLAVWKSNIEIIKILINAGADVNFRYKGDASPLIIATENGQLEIVELLLKSRAEVNISDNRGFTPLHIAVMGKRIDIIRTLLIHGANPYCINNEGYTPLHYAIEIGDDVSVRMLLKAKQELDASYQPHRPLNLLDFVIKCGHLELIKLFIESGEDINQRNQHGLTPLDIAIYKQNEEAIKLLIANGADINAGNPSPLIKAVLTNNYNIFKILLDAKCDPNRTDHQNATPLYFAVYNGNTEIARELLNVGADPNICNLYGITPLAKAVNSGNFDLVKILIEKSNNLITTISTSIEHVLNKLKKILNQDEFIKVFNLIEHTYGNELPAKITLNTLHIALLHKQDAIFSYLFDKIYDAEIDLQGMHLKKLAEIMGNQNALKQINEKFNIRTKRRLNNLGLYQNQSKQKNPKKFKKANLFKFKK